MNTIISKRTTPIEIIEYVMDKVQHRLTPIRSVTIQGGAHILDPKTLVTPSGVATEVTDEALEWLMKQPKFKKGLDAGVFRVIKGTKARTVDANEIAESGAMVATREIPGRPLTPEDVIKHGGTINDDGSIDITKGGKDTPSKVVMEINEIQRKKDLKNMREAQKAEAKKAGTKKSAKKE